MVSNGMFAVGYDTIGPESAGFPFQLEPAKDPACDAFGTA